MMCIAGCNVEGVAYQSGDRWSPVSDPCSTCRCEVGILERVDVFFQNFKGPGERPAICRTAF